MTPICGKETIVEALNSYFGSAKLLQYSESDDQMSCQVPAPIRDPQMALFRSHETVLNELAMSHRLSLLVGRSKYGLPEDFAFAIKSVETAVHSIEPVELCNIELRCEVIARRRDAVTAIRSTLITRYGVEARTTITSFNVLPPFLANFVRRGRQFTDYADVKISRAKSQILAVASNHFRYSPSEDDRLSDGRRVDHVPAITLIDIALFVNRRAHQSAVYANIAAEFMNYTDPRLDFDIVLRENPNVMEIVQNGQLVAIVYDRTGSCNSAIGERITQ